MPARVTIKPTVWADSRFQVLAALLGCNHYEAIGRMAAIWGECTDQETDRLEPAFLAVHLGCDPDQAGQILQRAKLGEILQPAHQPAASHVAGECLVRVRGCVGMTEWLAEKRAAAAKGGKARAAKAKRGVTGSFQPAHQPAASHVAGEYLADRLDNPPATSQPESSPPVPVPVPVPVSTLRVPPASARTGAHDMADPTKPSIRPTDRYAGLYRLWCDKGRQATEQANAIPERRIKLAWMPLPEFNLRHRIAETLHSQLCRGLSDAQIAHGLEMLVAEGLAKPVDDPDPFRWLRECWDAKRLATAVGIPSAAAARSRSSSSERARGSPGRGGKVTASDMFDLAEEFDRFQQEENDIANR